MSVEWTLVGEASKDWDTTSQTLEDRNVSEAGIELSSLDSDVLTLTIEPEDWRNYTPPELGQEVTLKRDSSSFFYGTVTNVQATVTGGSQTITVEVSGPWWWMDRIQLTDTQTDGSGSTGTRASYVFGTVSGVDLKTAIEDLIDRAIALGCPIQRGSVATFFSVPRITLNQSTCAQAFTELLRLVPDCFAWFDYTTSPPTLNVDRRGAASVTSLTIGTDAVTDLNLKPVYELKVDRVVLDYVDRDATGATQFQQQASGTAATGRVQTITVSGSEIDTFLPNELFDRLTIATTTTSLETALKHEFGWPGLADVISNWSEGGSGWSLELGSLTTHATETIENLSGTGNGNLSAPHTFTPQAALAGTRSFIIFENGSDPPEWAIDDYSLTRYEITQVGYVDGASGTSTPAFDFDRSEALFSVFSPSHRWFTPSKSNPAAIGASSYGWFVRLLREGEFSLWSIATADIPASGELTRSADYSFIAPPAGLASNLQSAQDFIPYEGAIRLIDEDAGASRYLGTVVNVSGSLTEHATMKALVAQERIDIKNGTTEIVMGTPERIDYRTFVDRIRSTAQDNVVYS